MASIPKIPSNPFRIEKSFSITSEVRESPGSGSFLEIRDLSMCFLGLSTMSLGMRAASVQKDSRRTKLELSKDRDLGEMSQFVCLPSNAEVVEKHLSA